MSLFSYVNVGNYTSMHACTMTEQDPHQVEVSSMPIEFATGAAGRRLQHPGCGRRRDLTAKKSMEFLFQSHQLADISMKKPHHQSSGYITVEWRGQQHAREAVESTASGATAAMQATSSQTG